MTKHMQSEEDYLERILILQSHGVVRSIDLSIDMNYSKPSISIAMKKLKEKGYITIDTQGSIRLTDEGMKIATKVYEKHTVLLNFLKNIGVSENQALIDACEIEHCISDETFEKLKKHYNDIKK
ncbi:MAG: metal-dependent transcriptional regulator [Anaeroplasmataceae bacterium]